MLSPPNGGPLRSGVKAEVVGQRVKILGVLAVRCWGLSKTGVSPPQVLGATPNSPQGTFETTATGLDENLLLYPGPENYGRRSQGRQKQGGGDTWVLPRSS